MSDNSRGSVWRRWDLHLHTPETQKNNQYAGRNPGEQWDGFYKTVHEYIGDGTSPIRNIAVVGITDYLSIKNYLKVKSDHRLPSTIKLVLPNIEARMLLMSGSSPINIHFIFDPKYEQKIESSFLARLECSRYGSTFTATKEGITHLGEKHAEASGLKGDAYQIGLEQFLIEYTSIKRIIDSDEELKKNIVLAAPNSNQDGVSGLDCSAQMEAMRQTLYRDIHFIFSGNEKDCAYFLGEKQSFPPEDIVRKYGKLIPCIHGCDAHENSKVFAPDMDRFCWVKADPTFEGFKQILYEPKDRVFIGAIVPATKPDYNVIDGVEIVGNNDFPSTPIYFNENLTCIIGGKSTGKSLLLHNMALAIDKEQAIKKTQKSGTKVQELSTIKVNWRDNYISGQNNAGENDSELRKIIYIPQTYLNRLSDEREETTEIDAIIEEIILQNEDSYADHGSMESSLKDKNNEITSLVIQLASTNRDIEKLHNERLEKGDEKGVNAEIAKLEGQLSELSKAFNVSDGDILKYQKAKELVDRHRRVLKAIENTKTNLGNVDTIISSLSIGADDFQVFKEEIAQAISLTVQESDQAWKVHRSELLRRIDEKNTEILKELDDNLVTVAELEPKITGHSQITQLSNSITLEKQRLDLIKELNTKIEALKESFQSILLKICTTFFDFKKIQEEFSKKLNQRLSELPPDDLEFRVDVVFRTAQFGAVISEVLRNPSFTHFKYREMLTKPSDDNVTIESLSEFILSIVSTSSKSLILKSEFDVESGLRNIFTNWFNINYIVKLDNDDIYDMSPGKKALVLLRLLINLAESTCPILIDQPEDDLDNRSIFGELIDFIKRRKTNRQIIVVTHNANIVVGSDAELVIVANQDGKNSPNATHRFEYRAGSIENNIPIAAGSHGILDRQGIQGHICDILEGGLAAFELRGKKYRSLTN